jgi:hypothetical protein
VRKGLPDPSLSHHPFYFNLAHLLDILLLPRASQVDALVQNRSLTDARPCPAVSPLRPRKKSSTPTLHVDSPWPPAPCPNPAVDQEPLEHRQRPPLHALAGGPHRNPNLGELLLSLSSPTVRSSSYAPD